jgi:hypothetical protein
MAADDTGSRSSLGQLDDSLVAEDGVDSAPLPEVKIRWTAVLTLVAFIAAVAAIAQVVGPVAAGIITVTALAALVLSAAWSLHRRHADAYIAAPALGEAIVWHGDGFANCDFGGGGDC